MILYNVWYRNGTRGRVNHSTEIYADTPNEAIQEARYCLAHSAPSIAQAVFDVVYEVERGKPVWVRT